MISEGSQKPTDDESPTVAPDGYPHNQQPKWRRDFPIDLAEDAYVARREFIKFVVLTSVAFSVGQIWLVFRSIFGKKTVSWPVLAIARMDELPIGGAKTFRYPEDSSPRLLVRTGEQTFVAYDQQCTHLQCPVVPAIETNRLFCPCHNGYFDLQTGAVLAGPPRRNLAKIDVELRDGMVYAVGVQESVL